MISSPCLKSSQNGQISYEGAVYYPISHADLERLWNFISKMTFRNSKAPSSSCSHCLQIRAFAVFAWTSRHHHNQYFLQTGLIMIGVIIGSRKVGINPDNVATPIAASLGDLITLALLSGISTGLYQELGEWRILGNLLLLQVIGGI